MGDATKGRERLRRAVHVVVTFAALGLVLGAYYGLGVPSALVWECRYPPEACCDLCNGQSMWALVMWAGPVFLTGVIGWGIYHAIYPSSEHVEDGQ